MWGGDCPGREPKPRGAAYGGCGPATCRYQPARADYWHKYRGLHSIWGFLGYIGLIEGITSRIKAEYGKPMKVIGTGGLAPLFAQAQSLFDTIEDDLTMHGLTVIHNYNKEHAQQ